MGRPNELADVATSIQPLAECLVACVLEARCSTDPERSELMVGTRRVSALRAVSCLVALEPDDVVSVIRDSKGTHYVTAVLQRSSNSPLTLFSQRALSVRSASQLTIGADDSLELQADNLIRFRTSHLDALVGRLSAITRSLAMTTGEALLNSRAARICSTLIDIAAERIGVSARDSHRQISGSEQLRCQHFDLRAEQVAQIRAGSTLVKSRDLVKMDAKQIQIG
ncbi:hypothetical protein BH10PSE17_BH10PSE17_02010 [soil metagenome]